MNKMKRNRKIWRSNEPGAMRMAECEYNKILMPNFLYEDLKGKKFHTQTLILNILK